jgi:signal transduction histidine kinase
VIAAEQYATRLVVSASQRMPARVEGDKAIVSIANTGPVIPPEQVHRLFEPFQRLDRPR